MKHIIGYDATVTESQLTETDPDDGTGLKAKFWVESDPVLTDEHGAMTRLTQGFVCAEDKRPRAGERVRVTVEIIEKES